MDLERFLVEHDVNRLLGDLFWVWVAGGVGVFYLFYRLGLARFPRPGAVLRGAERGIFALLLMVLLAPFAAFGGGYRPGQGWDDDLDG